MKTTLCAIATFLFIYISYGQRFNDEFNNSVLSPDWNLYQDQYFDTPVPQESGFMSMILDNTTCRTQCVWFHQDSAGFIYQTVTGDFDVTTAVYAKKISNPSQDIDAHTQLAGLMARNPASLPGNNENYIFNVAGVRFGVRSVETKSTQDHSTRRIWDYTDNMLTTSTELRIVRVGSLFEFYSRPIGSSSWIFRNDVDRPDLPTTLHVGLIAYIFDAHGNGDLRANFDYIRFSDTTLGIDNFPLSPTLTNNIVLKTYPIPARESISVTLSGYQKSGNALIEVFDLTGQKHVSFSKKAIDDMMVEEIDLSRLSSGSYFINIQMNDTKLTKVILKE